METQPALKPTEGELEILQILWEKGECTVREVHNILEQTKATGYTTTLKQMQIMLERGFITRDDSTGSHIYKASLSQDLVQKQAVNKMIGTLFSGSPVKLVMQALGSYSTSKEEMDLITEYIRELKK